MFPINLQKVFVLQLPDWTRLGEIKRMEGQAVLKCALEVLLGDQLGCVRCHKQKGNGEPIPQPSQSQGMKICFRKSIKRAMYHRVVTTMKKGCFSWIQSWWTKAVKCIWRANSVPVPLTFLITKSFWKSTFQHSTRVLAGMCRLLLGMLIRPLRLYLVSVSCWSSIPSWGEASSCSHSLVHLGWSANVVLHGLSRRCSAGAQLARFTYGQATGPGCG